MEEWRNIDHYDNYQVSNLGNVRNSKTGRILKAGKSGCGYLTVGLTKNNTLKTFKIHKLVTEHFFEKIESSQFVDHIDGNKHNNILSNLRWATRSQNMANRRTYKSGNQGVYLRPNRSKQFEVCIQHENRYIYIGMFDTLEEAREAYKKAKNEYCGEFSPFNDL